VPECRLRCHDRLLPHELPLVCRGVVRACPRSGRRLTRKLSEEAVRLPRTAVLASRSVAVRMSCADPEAKRGGSGKKYRLHLSPYSFNRYDCDVEGTMRRFD